MSQQKALYLTGRNGDWVIREKGIPKPGPGQLLVKIYSTSLNTDEWILRKKPGLFQSWPVIVGSEAAGTVEEVGFGISGFAKGDRVFFQGNYTNDESTFQQYTLQPAEITGKIPSTLSFDEAASIPAGAGTAIEALYGSDRKGSGAKQFTAPWKEGGVDLYKGKPILVIGGSSSIGQYAIQFAKLSGFSPIIATASFHNADLLKAFGATHVVDCKSDIEAEVKKITSEPIDFIFDAISEGGTQEQAWEILASGGTIITIMRPSFDVYKYEDKYFWGINTIAAFHRDKQLGITFAKFVPKLFEERLIKPNSVEVFPGGLSSVETGLKHILENKVSDYKLVVHPHKTP